MIKNKTGTRIRKAKPKVRCAKVQANPVFAQALRRLKPHRSKAQLFSSLPGSVGLHWVHLESSVAAGAWRLLWQLLVPAVLM